MKALRGLVAGKVQRVWYRKSVQQGCLEAGLRGYARNLPDGRVEVVLMGTPEQVELGKTVVSRGSPYSLVSGVEWHELAELPEIADFQVL